VFVTVDSRVLASDLSLAVVRLARHLRSRRADAKVSLTQLSAMATLAREGAMTPGALAARERVQPPSMTRVIASLLAAGFVERAPHPTDGRQVIVTLSETGLALIADETHAREVWMNSKLADLDETQLKSLEDAVAIITTLVNESD